jgi:hypothetical protein
MNMDSCFRRNDGMGPDESALLQQLVTLVPDQVRDDGSGVLQQAVTPGEDPGSMLIG